MAFIEHRLAQHHRGEGKAGFGKQAGKLFLQAVAYQLHVADDHRLEGGIQHRRCFIESLAKRPLIAGRLGRRQERARCRTPHPHDVGWQAQVDGPLLCQASGEHAIDVRRRRFATFEQRRGGRDPRIHLERDLVIAQRVVQQGTRLEVNSRRCSGDRHHRHPLGECAGQTVSALSSPTAYVVTYAPAPLRRA